MNEQIIIHNAAFDVGFLNEELRRAGRGNFADHVGQVIDTLSMARDQYPGKSNSLDALCKRLEVNNTARTFHGALLDAQLLAQVYIHMTRGQDSLVSDSSANAQAQSLMDQSPVDFSQYPLPTLLPTEEELQAHEAMLEQLDKASKNQTVWRRA